MAKTNTPKAKQAAKKNEPTLQEKFDIVMNTQKETLKALIIVSTRPDTLTDILVDARDTYKIDLSLPAVKALANVIKATYNMILLRHEELTLKDVMESKDNDEWDILKDIVPETDTLEDMQDLMVATITFNAMRPFATRLREVRQLVLEEMEDGAKD